MYKINNYAHEEFGEIEIIIIDGKEYFPATEVARILGYNNTTKAIKDHCRWVTKSTVPHPQSTTKTIEKNFIPESDLYRLIARSKLPTAEKFEKWVFDELLPTIRKTGSYIIEQEKELSTVDVLKIATAEIEKLSKRNKEVTDVLLAYQKGKDTWLIRQFVKYVRDEKGITIGEQTMHEYLRQNYFDRDGLPYARYMSYFALKRNHKNGKERKPTIKLTQRGVNYFTNKLLKEKQASEEGITCQTSNQQ